MKCNNIVYSGFSFDDNESLLKFKFRMLNYILIIIAFFSALFGLMSDLKINDIGPIHTKVDYAYSFSAVCIFLYLRRSKSNYFLAAQLTLLVSYLTFISALVNVPQDEFRIIWFYLLMYISYILSGSKYGIAYTVLSIVAILVSNYYTDLMLSELAITSGVLGLVIGSLLSVTYTNKINSYEKSINKRNVLLEKMASTDALTGIMNRRSFDEISNKYFETAQRHDKLISVLEIDLDHFKNVNDTYGHMVGDQVLIAFVDALKKVVRTSDVFARTGGEEFSIILFNTSTEEAEIFCKKLFSVVSNVYVTCNNRDIQVTISIGVSQNRKDDKYFKDIFVRADKALYKSKTDGRNQVTVLL